MTQADERQADVQTVLVVDDDLLSIEMLVSILAQEYRVLTAQSGPAALDLLRVVRPDLILLDLVMPEMDGYTLFQLIKEQPALADLPVLFLTCMTEAEFEVKGLELGAVDYIAKPYNPHIVRLRIRNHLLLKSRQDQLAAQTLLQRELVCCEQKFRSYVEVSPLGIFVVDGEGRFYEVNRAGAELFGYQPFELLGKPMTVLLTEESREAALRHFEAVKTVGLADDELPLRRKDGSVIWVKVVAAPLPDGGFVAFKQDMTQRRMLETSLAAARDAAEAANRAKSEFLANMSHEIRTPMNGIVGMAQLLGLTPLNQAQQQYLEAIEVSADNLLDLISDILDLSKVEAGKVELEYSRFSLHKAVQDVVTTQRSRMQQKGLQLQLELPDELPQPVWGDQLRLKQILLNLLGNAVKFTEQGTITLSLAVLEFHDRSVLIRITVADTGIGIEPDMLGSIFQAFSQADSSITRRFGGSGLGLNICSKLAQLMGGAITVESEPGQGSRFHLELPFDLPLPAQTVDHASEAVPVLSAVPPLTVLVAEDNEVNSHTAEQMLQILGHRPQICRDGRAAVDCWARGGVDLILMDIQMPVMGGEEALQLIRSAEAGQGYRTPVVALTADALYGTRERLLAAGFDGYLAKPFRLATLTAELQQAMMAGDGDRQP